MTSILNLYHGTIDTGTIGLSNIDFVYKIQSYYFCLYTHRLRIFTKLGTELQLTLDINFTKPSTKPTRKYLSIFKDKLKYQEVIGYESLLRSNNLDGSLYEPPQTVAFFNPIVHAWNDERYVLEPYNYNLFLKKLDGSTARVYGLPQPLVWLSNPVFISGCSIYFLGKLNNGLYSLFLLDDNIQYSGHFQLDFFENDSNYITISIENEQLSIWCPLKDRTDVIFLVKPLNELQFGNKIPGEILFRSSNITYFRDRGLKHMEAGDFYKAAKLIKGIADLEDNPPFIDLVGFSKHFEKYSVETQTLAIDDNVVSRFIENPINLDVSNPTIYIQSDKYLDYFQWIVNNYENYDIKYVIFYKDYLTSISYYLNDNVVIQPVDLFKLSRGFDNYVIPMGKCCLSNGKTYKRRLQYHQNINQNYSLAGLNGFSKGTDLDRYIESTDMNLAKRNLISLFFVSLGITHNELIWTPVMFFKVDMRLIRERPVDYYKQIIEILDRRLALADVYSYLFYSLIYSNKHL